jgi:hypothetical protein
MQRAARRTPSARAEGELTRHGEIAPQKSKQSSVGAKSRYEHALSRKNRGRDSRKDSIKKKQRGKTRHWSDGGWHSRGVAWYILCQHPPAGAGHAFPALAQHSPEDESGRKDRATQLVLAAEIIYVLWTRAPSSDGAMDSVTAGTARTSELARKSRWHAECLREHTAPELDSPGDSLSDDPDPTSLDDLSTTQVEQNHEDD